MWWHYCVIFQPYLHKRSITADKVSLYNWSRVAEVISWAQKKKKNWFHLIKSEDLLIISSMKAELILIMIHKQETDKRFLQKINQLFGKKEGNQK